MGNEQSVDPDDLWISEEERQRLKTLRRMVNRIYEEKVKIDKLEKKRNTEYCQHVVFQILDYIRDESDLFRGVLICVGSAYQGFKVGEANEYDYNIPLNVSKVCGQKDFAEWGCGFYGFNARYRDQELTLATIPDDCEVISRGVPYMDTAIKYMDMFDTFVATFDKMSTKSERGAAEAGSSSQERHTGQSGYTVEKGQPQPRDVGPGFRFVWPEGPGDKKRFKQLAVPGEACPDIIPFLVRRALFILLVHALRDLDLHGVAKIKRRNNWPALTLDILRGGKFVASVDFTPIIGSGDFTPPEKINLPRRGKSWPAEDKVEAIQAYHGPNLVAMKPFHWQISYAECEKELARNLDFDGGCRKKAHRIMKEINKTIWCPTTKSAISSYILKNILFWECERYPETERWVQDKLWIRIESMTKALLQALEDESLPQFFDPDINLIAQRDQGECFVAKGKVNKFLLNPLDSMRKAYGTFLGI